jgi:hypothetical protein
MKGFIQIRETSEVTIVFDSSENHLASILAEKYLQEGYKKTAHKPGEADDQGFIKLYRHSLSERKKRKTT